MAKGLRKIGGVDPGLSGDLYGGYEIWKDWSKPFTVTAEDAAYFAGETRGTKIEDGDVLEIGFGSGSFLAWARACKARVVGTEINLALLAAARDLGFDLLPPDIETVADKHERRFDTIVAFDVFEHFTLATVAAQARAAETMLKPGGHLVLRFPNAQSPFGLAPQNGDPTHKSALSRSAIEPLIQATSFAIVRYAPSYRIGRGGLAKWLARRLRYIARDLISGLLNAIYAQNIPWDSVVVLVLRKKLV